MIDAFLTDRSLLRRSLSLFGLAIVTWSVIAQYAHGDIAPWAFWCVLGANAVWLVLVFLPSRFVGVTTVCLCLMVVLGGIAAAETQGVGVAPAAVGVLWQTRDIRQSVNRAIALGVGCMLVVLVGSFISPISSFGLVAMEAGVAVAFLGGESRRQSLLAQRRANELVEEQARADVLAARQHIAHDIHDVLAHSLGGLVIQLDAVDALLESGDSAGAAKRIREARTLAADGLSEARRAVATLREASPDESSLVSGDALVSELTVLLETHRSLDGTVDFRESGTRANVSGAVDLALRRAVQEGLTNARKHAPGASVRVRLVWGQTDVSLRIENRANDPRVSTSGHGLVGMRERFAAISGGQAEADFVDGSFVVTASAPLRQVTA